MKKFADKYGIWIIIFLFTLGYFLIGSLRHSHFLAGGYDLAHYSQAVWQYSQGKLAKVTIFGNIYVLGDHFEPILMLFAPFYLIFPDPKMLIFIQAAFAVFAAWPIFLFSKKIIKNIWLSYIPCFLYLLHPSLQYALDYDFHTSTVMVFPLAFLYWAFERKRRFIYWLCVSYIILTKEDGAIFAGMFGLYLLVFRKRKKLGLITFIICLLFFYIIQFKLMPFFYGGDRSAARFMDFYVLGDSISEMIKNAFYKPWLVIWSLFDNKEKLLTLGVLFGSFSFLPLFSIYSLFNSLPFLLEKFLSSTESRWLFNQYHQVNILPVLAFGYLYSLKKIAKKNELLTKGVLVISFLVILGINRLMHLPLTRLFHLSYYRQTEVEENIKKGLEEIPEDVSVSAQFPFTSHLSTRHEIYLFPDGEDKVEYIVLSLNGLPTYPLTERGIEKKVKKYKASKKLKIIYDKEKTYIFKKNIN